MTKKPKRRDAGRPRGQVIEEALLARTLEELVEHGIEGASVDRIARAAEVNKTSVYRRFKTREGLIVAALERVAVDLSTQLSDQGSLRGDLEQVAELVGGLLSSPLGRGLAQAALVHPEGSELKAQANRELDRPRAAALAMVERARARGEWREEVSAEALLSSLVGALMHRVLLEQRALDEAFVTQVVELLAAGAAPARDRPGAVERGRT